MTAHGISIVGWQAISALGVGADALRAADPMAAPAAGPPQSTDPYPQDIAYRPAHFGVAALIGAKEGPFHRPHHGARPLHGAPAAWRPAPYGEQSRRTEFVLAAEVPAHPPAPAISRATSRWSGAAVPGQPRPLPEHRDGCAAGQCAIRFQGPRAGERNHLRRRLSGLLALRYASQMPAPGLCQTGFWRGARGGDSACRLP